MSNFYYRGQVVPEPVAVAPVALPDPDYDLVWTAPDGPEGCILFDSVDWDVPLPRVRPPPVGLRSYSPDTANVTVNASSRPSPEDDVVAEEPELKKIVQLAPLEKSSVPMLETLATVGVVSVELDVVPAFHPVERNFDVLNSTVLLCKHHPVTSVHLPPLGCPYVTKGMLSTLSVLTDIPITHGGALPSYVLTALRPKRDGDECIQFGLQTDVGVVYYLWTPSDIMEVHAHGPALYERVLTAEGHRFYLLHGDMADELRQVSLSNDWLPPTITSLVQCVKGEGAVLLMNGLQYRAKNVRTVTLHLLDGVPMDSNYNPYVVKGLPEGLRGCIECECLGDKTFKYLHCRPYRRHADSYAAMMEASTSVVTGDLYSLLPDVDYTPAVRYLSVPQKVYDVKSYRAALLRTPCLGPATWSTPSVAVPKYLPELAHYVAYKYKLVTDVLIQNELNDRRLYSTNGALRTIMPRRLANFDCVKLILGKRVYFGSSFPPPRCVIALVIPWSKMKGFRADRSGPFRHNNDPSANLVFYLTLWAPIRGAVFRHQK